MIKIQLKKVRGDTLRKLTGGLFSSVFVVSHRSEVLVKGVGDK
jgi:hypothetical protein